MGEKSPIDIFITYNINITTVMKAIGIFAIDSWHLDGTHFPEVKTSGIKEYNIAINFLVDMAEIYGLRNTEDNKVINKKVIMEHLEHNMKKISFDYPREGYLILCQEK